jgi:phosphatidylserine decarboxylase
MSSFDSGSRLIAALRLLPKNALSRLAGRFVSIRWPRPLQRLQIHAFARAFGVDLDEVKDPIDSFACLQDFFVRELVDGARPLPQDPMIFVSPCDGAWGESGRVEKGMLLQVKGRPYALASLIGGEGRARTYEGGWFATIYLSPKDYHRFHSPCDARVSRLRYLPGNLWPVNRAGVEGVDSLFAENERICAFFDLVGAGGEESLCIVAVGATMVGKVKVDFDALTTNVPGAVECERDLRDQEIALARGQQWGRFEFGSTLVLVGRPGSFELEPRPSGTPVRLGEAIGRCRGDAGSA